MTTASRPSVERAWKFQCPECEFTDEEFGHLAADEEVYCEVCMAESHRYIRLRRWFEAKEEAGAIGR